MRLGEIFGGQKKPKLTPEQEKENRRVAIVREILMLEARMEEVGKNMRMFGSAPADQNLLGSLQERINKLNETLVTLGRKPITRE